MNRVNIKRRRQIIYDKQKDNCNTCKKKLEGNSFCLDHLKPLALRGTNEDSNLQVLYIPCHLDKTKKEIRDRKNKSKEKRT